MNEEIQPVFYKWQYNFILPSSNTIKLKINTKNMHKYNRISSIGCSTVLSLSSIKIIYSLATFATIVNKKDNFTYSTTTSNNDNFATIKITI